MLGSGDPYAFRNEAPDPDRLRVKAAPERVRRPDHGMTDHAFPGRIVMIEQHRLGRDLDLISQIPITTAISDPDLGPPLTASQRGVGGLAVGLGAARSEQGETRTRHAGG